MKKSQTTSTKVSGGNARKTTSFFDILKQHQSDLKRSVFQLRTKNEKFVREQYNYMDNLFEKGPSPELIQHQQSFQLSTDMDQSQVLEKGLWLLHTPNLHFTYIYYDFLKCSVRIQKSVFYKRHGKGEIMPSTIHGKWKPDHIKSELFSVTKH